MHTAYIFMSRSWLLNRRKYFALKIFLLQLSKAVALVSHNTVILETFIVDLTIIVSHLGLTSKALLKL